MSQLGPSGSAFAIMVKAQPRMWATKMMRKRELKMPMSGASTCAQRGAAEQGSVLLRCCPLICQSKAAICYSRHAKRFKVGQRLRILHYKGTKKYLFELVRLRGENA